MAYGGVEVQLHSFLISAVEKGEQSASHPSDLTPQKRCWMAPEPVQLLWRKAKSCAPTGNQTPSKKTLHWEILCFGSRVTDSYEIMHFDSNTHPSISDSSWLMVWLAYGCNTELVLFAPTESISSMKITHGARSFAASAEQNNTRHFTSLSARCAILNTLRTGDADLRF